MSQETQLQTRIVNIEGMTCDGCVRSVHNAANGLDGVQTVSVDLKDNLATVTFDTSKVDIKTVAQAIDDAGFDASVANS